MLGVSIFIFNFAVFWAVLASQLTSDDHQTLFKALRGEFNVEQQEEPPVG